MNPQPYLSISISLTRSGEQSGAEQIVAGIKSQIESNHAPSGCRLPPVRVLAHQLGISKTTVQTAYDELVAQGIVESRRRIGLFVAEKDPRISPLAQSRAAAPVLKAATSLTPASNHMINLSGVYIDPALLPREKIATCIRSVANKSHLPLNAHPQGYPPLREIIAQRLNRRGIEANPDDVVITVGSQQALDIAGRVLQEKKIATESPSYHLGKKLFEHNGVKLTGLPVDPFNGIDCKLWKRIIKREKPALLCLTTNFQNPTGYSYSTSELNHILEWSERYGFGILEDDWGSDILSFSEFKPSLRARGGDNVLYINSFTKKLLLSLRLGYIVGNAQTTPALVEAKHLSCFGAPAVIEAALFEFLDRGYYDTHLKQLQTELDRRYKHCLRLLRTMMPDGVRWTSPGGGPELWLEMPPSVPLVSVISSLMEKGIFIQHNPEAFFGKPHLHGFRIGYASISTSHLQQGIEILAAELKKHLTF